MWTLTTWLFPMFLLCTTVYVDADAGSIQETDGSEASENAGGLSPRYGEIPADVLATLVQDHDSYDRSSEKKTDRKRDGNELSRLNLGEGYSRYGRANLQQLMSSLDSGYNRSNRKGLVSLTRHNLDLGYSRYGRSPAQLTRLQLGKGFNRYGRPDPKELNRYNLGTGYNRYGRTREAGQPSSEEERPSDSGVSGSNCQSQRWTKKPSYNKPTSDNDFASKGHLPYDKDDSAMSDGGRSPRLTRDVIDPFRSWLSAHARPFVEAKES